MPGSESSAWLDGKPGAVPLAKAHLLAPLPRPPKIICVGLNYRDHAIESKMEIPKVPTIFSKYTTAVIGPGDPIVLPKLSAKPDYEAEFAFVDRQRRPPHPGRSLAGSHLRLHQFP